LLGVREEVDVVLASTINGLRLLFLGVDFRAGGYDIDAELAGIDVNAGSVRYPRLIVPQILFTGLMSAGTEFAASRSLSGVIDLPDDDFAVSHGTELRGVVAKGGGMNVHRRFFAADDFFLREIVELPKAGIVTAESEQPLAIRMEHKLFNEPFGVSGEHVRALSAFEVEHFNSRWAIQVIDVANGANPTG
jgi:hypothetical protein